MLGRSRFRDRGRGSGVGGANLLNQATIYLGGVAPYHWLDFINNRALYAGLDVGNVTGATGYSFTRASDGYYENADGTLTLFGSGALRRGDRGVLIEGSRTNLLVRSQEFGTTWQLNSATISTDATTAPDGTETADKIIASAGSAGHRIQQAVTVSAATAYAVSIFVKASEYSKFGLVENNTTGAYASFNLSGAGTVINTGSGGSGLITALGNGWYRVTLLCTTGGAQTSYRLDLYPLPDSYTTGTPAAAYTGDGTSGLFIWGAQLEQASFQSSYIPTVAAAATRAADSLSYTAGVTYPIQLFAEFERVVDTGASETALQIDAGGNTDRAVIFVNSVDAFQATVASGGVGQANVSVSGALALNTVYKGAARVSTNSVQAARGGTLGTEDTSVTNPATPTLMRVGAEPGGGAPPFGYIRRIAVIQGAGTDAQLQSMTT